MNSIKKSIKTILLVAIIATSSLLSASTEPVKEVKPTVITQEIGELLKNPTFEIEKDLLANVTLTVNKNNEIVVLSVDSENQRVVNYIKNRLNYNKLSVNVDSQTYKVPVRITVEDN